MIKYGTVEGKKIKIAEHNGLLTIETNGDIKYLDESIDRYSAYDVANDVHIGVVKELDRQFTKWGLQFHNVDQWNSITVEEYGEMVAAINKQNWDEAMKEGIEMIACAIQLLNEVQRQKEGRTNGDYTRQG